MFPSLFSNTKRNIIAGLTAVSLLAAGTSPALAWGKPEQNFVAGAASVLLLGSLFNGYARPYYYAPRPIYVEPRPIYRAPPPPYCYRCYYRPAPIWHWRGPWWR